MAYKYCNRARTYAYLTTPADTTCTLANTFYPIVGTFENDPMVDFDVSVGKLRYIGNRDQSFELDWAVSLSNDALNETVHIGISINGNVLDITEKSVMGLFIKYAGENVTLSGTVVETLSKNDTIELQISSSGTGDVITIDHFTTTIRRFE